MTDSIIQFTPGAFTYIQNLIAKRNNEQACFYLTVKKAGCSGYMYLPEIIEQPNPQDYHLLIEDSLNVYLAPECIPIIKGTTIDLISKGLGQQQLYFRNPNASSECGCGESFYIDEDES